jgi:hypothetical protein
MASEAEKQQYINAVLEEVWESTPIERQALWKQFIESESSRPDPSINLWSTCSRVPASHPCQEMWSLLQQPEIGNYIRAFIETKIRADKERTASSARRALSNVEQLLDDPKASNPMPQTRSMGLMPPPRIPYRPNVRLLKRIENVDEIVNPNENYLLVARLMNRTGTLTTTTYLGKFMAQTTMKAQFEKNGWPADPSDWIPTTIYCGIDRNQVNNAINAALGGYYIYLCDPLGQLIINGRGEATQDPNNVINPIYLAEIIQSIPLPQDVQHQVALGYFQGGPAMQGDQGGGQSKKAIKAIKAIKARKSRRRRQSRRRRRSKK